ncbi:tyrosine-protein phosphatase, partial [Alteromonas stellipolaris]
CGVTHLVCTPHIHPGFFDNTPAIIENAYNELVLELQRQHIPLKLSYAAELRVSEHIPIWIKQNAVPFLGDIDGKKVMLLEMPHSHIPSGLEPLIKWLLKNNVQPLIAHPERNRELLREQHKFDWLRRIGCWFQVTAGAITGRFGEPVQNFALTLLANKSFHVVASDTHDTVRRPNDMGEAFAVVSALDAAYAQQVFVTTPGKIVGASSDLI